ncbi:hypothetical protein LJB77_02555 [Ruminococcaceae bacterium OttesenSCG-928-N02]|nr:hypothetical protein [Ruminococcaceae bacterium OttesenSCG-928-N02]
MQNEITKVAAQVAALYKSPPLAFVHTFGCQQNVNDSEKIRGVLALLGYGFSPSEDGADLIIFNTCAIREHAELKIFGNIGALKARKKANPNLLIGLCGCMVQQPHIVEKVRVSYPYVDLVFGVNAIDTLPSLLSGLLAGQKRNITPPRACKQCYQ